MRKSKFLDFLLKGIDVLVAVLIGAGIVLGICGCEPEDDGHASGGATNGVRAVCIGVESGFAGACPGAVVDAKRMANLLWESGVGEVELLTEGAATRKAVLEKMKWAVDGELAIVFYSGHGGQNWTGDLSEEDGKDEFMCLWDKGLLDDDIWEVLSQGKRVVLVCDCCHSKTMFRAGERVLRMVGRMSRSKDGKKKKMPRRMVQLLCWSGCPDSEYSYGSSDGGELTNALLRHFKNGMSYRELWKAILGDKSLKSFEDVQETVLGTDFRDLEAFK